MQKTNFIYFCILIAHFSCSSMNSENTEEESARRISVSFINETNHCFEIISPAKKNHVALHHSQECPSETFYINASEHITLSLPQDKYFDISTEHITQTKCASTISNFFRIIATSNRRWKIIHNRK